MVLSFEWDKRKADMKKRNKSNARNSDKTRPEYDFSKGVRGKHAARYAAGSNVVGLSTRRR
jgi:hypothetical protein